MKKVAGAILLLLLGATLLAAQNRFGFGGFGQNRSGFVGSRTVIRNFPGGPQPGVQRTTGSVVHPGSPSRNVPQIGIPSVPIIPPNFSSGRVFRSPFGKGVGFRTGFGKSFDFKNGDFFRKDFGFRNDFGFNGGFGNFGGSVIPYPVYVGDSGGFGGDYPPPPPSEPNVIVVYPQSAPPVTINQFGNGAAPAARVYQPPERPVVVEEAPRPAYFLIAFKDKSVYTAMGYWVDGDTLHYITVDNTHNQASVSLVDRELTAQLNRDSGLEVKLPPVK